ncbi:hypothetical protein D3C87_1835300 [compost metagenome]
MDIGGQLHGGGGIFGDFYREIGRTGGEIVADGIEAHRQNNSKKVGKTGFVFEAGLFADRRRHRAAQEIEGDVLGDVERHEFGHSDALAGIRRHGDIHACLDGARG